MTAVHKANVLTISDGLFLREVRKVGGKLANVEVETVATNVKDPWKELNKK